MTIVDGERSSQQSVGSRTEELSSSRVVAWRGLAHGVERFGLLVLLAGLFAFFSLNSTTSHVFLSVANLRALVGNEAMIAILALAATIPSVAGEFDVSIGAVLAASSIVAAKLSISGGLPLSVAICIAIAVGALIGAINGLVISRLRVSSFVITLGISTLLGGILSLYSDNLTIVGVSQTLLDFGNRNILGLPDPIWLVLLIALAAGYMLRFTVFGRQLLSIGSNRQAAHLVGINTSRIVFMAFVISGALAAVAGVVSLARTGSASAQVGPNFTLAALAAAFLGATTITPGRFNVLGTLVGVLFVGVAVNGFTLMGAADWVEPVFNGGAVVIAVSLASYLSQRRAST